MSEKNFHITVQIADRPYHVMASDEHEKECVLQAEERIRQSIRQVRKQYSVFDKQDSLAMTALLLCTDLLENEAQAQGNEADLLKQLTQLDEILTEFLKKD